MAESFKKLKGVKDVIEDPNCKEAIGEDSISMYVGGYEKRVEDPEVRYWTNWAGIKTYKHGISSEDTDSREYTGY